MSAHTPRQLMMRRMRDVADSMLKDEIGRAVVGHVTCEARWTPAARTPIQHTWKVDGKVVSAKHITEDMFDDTLAERGGASASEA